MNKRKNLSIYVRNVIFGVEDSLVSTVGFLSGLAFVGMDEKTLVLTGLIYIFVEGFSMAMGSYMSEESTEEYEQRRAVSPVVPLLGAGAMLVSSIGAGLIPIIPYFFLAETQAVIASIIASLSALGLLGYAHARVSGLPSLPRIFRTMLLGGVAILIGLAVGQIFGVS